VLGDWYTADVQGKFSDRIRVLSSGHFDLTIGAFMTKSVSEHASILFILAGVVTVSLRACAAGQQTEMVPRASVQSMADDRLAGRSAIKYATDFNWTLAIKNDFSTPGPKTIRLEHCPRGVVGGEPEYWIYLSEPENAEAVKVTGGTCTGNEQAGTLSFTTKRGHVDSLTLGSASGGLQEASVAARWPNHVAPIYIEGGKVVAPPGEFKVYAPVSFLARNQTIDFSGSMFECWISDNACLKIGAESNYNRTSNVTLINPRGRPTQLHGRQPMIAVYGQKTRILNLMAMGGVEIGQGAHGTFGSYVSVVGDQAFLLDGLDSAAGWALECTPSYCGSVIVAPGPFGHPSNAAVGWIKHAQISMQCTGNGLDWQSGNTLRLSDSVLQGYSQFGLRGGTARGGYGTIMMENVYMEDAASCPNPKGNIGTAGIIIQGGKLAFRGGEGPSGHVPQFASTGTTRYDYFVVARHEKFGASNPLYAGFVLTNGNGNITVTTPDVVGAVAFDLLRVPSREGHVEAPNGTGAFVVVNAMPRAAACSGGVCNFTDTQKMLSTYTVSSPSYFPKLEYWPGALVLASNGDSESVLTSATAILSDLNEYFLGSETNTSGSTAPAILSEQCLLAQGSPLWMSCFTSALPPSVQYNQSALVLSTKPNNDGGLNTNLKGRLNLGTSGSGPSHFITLVDSNFAKTVASGANRPTNDVNDTFIGYDQGIGMPSSIGLSFGAPQSISDYIGGVGDGKNWKERLTDKRKIFAVPVVIENGSTLTVGGGSPLSQVKLYTAAIVPASPVSPQSCVDIKGAVAGLNPGEQILGITPPKPLGNLGLNAYVGAANVLTLHFCNPSSSTVSAPSGTYTFLGLR
jgi:hypothetical protein